MAANKANTTRTFRSSPERTTQATWDAISDLLAGSNPAARSELDSVSGVASCIIADRVCKDSPIVIHCDGGQTRIYCLYDEDAIDGSGSNEGSLGFDPLLGDWKISFPCESSDIEWLQIELQKKSSRVTVREKSESRSQKASDSASRAPKINTEEFLKP